MEEPARPKREGRQRTFPVILYTMLEQIELEGLVDIISWRPHGRTFHVHKINDFEEHVLPRFFRHRKFVSFQRQLNIYNFRRITFGPEQNCYFNENFIRGRPELIMQIKRLPTGRNSDSTIAYSSSDLINYYHGIVHSPTTQQTAIAIPSGQPSNLTSSTASQHFISSLQENTVTYQMLMEILARQNVVTGSTSNASPASEVQATPYATTQTTEQALSVILQQTGALRNYLQLMQSNVTTNNDRRVPETLGFIQSLLSTATTNETQHQIAPSQSMSDSRIIVNNLLNRLSPTFGDTTNNMRFPETLGFIQSLLSTATTNETQHQIAPSHSMSDSRIIVNNLLNQTSRLRPTIGSGHNSGSGNIDQSLFSTTPFRGVQQRAPVLALFDNRNDSNIAINQTAQPHPSTLFGSNLVSDRYMMELLNNAQNRLGANTVLPPMVMPTGNNILQQLNASVQTDQLQRLAETARHNLPMNYQDINLILGLRDIDRSESNEGKDDSVVPSRK